MRRKESSSSAMRSLLERVLYRACDETQGVEPRGTESKDEPRNGTAAVALSRPLKSRSRRYHFGDVKIPGWRGSIYGDLRKIVIVPLGQGAAPITDCLSGRCAPSLRQKRPLRVTGRDLSFPRRPCRLRTGNCGIDEGRLTFGPGSGQGRRRRGAKLSAWACQRRHARARPGRRALLRAADAARQDHRRLHRHRSAGQGRRRLFPRRCRASARKRWSTSSISTSCALASWSRICPRCSACSRHGTARAQRPWALLIPIRACRRLACASCSRHIGPPMRRQVSARRSSDAGLYEAHRIALGIPRGGVDFGYGDAFPHEADMDQLGGVDFAKGCYVGQEVVSRMEHRGIARTRAVPVGYDGAAPQAGATITAGERQSAPWARRPAAAGLRCCASTASPRRSRAARHCSPAACRCGRSSRTGRGLPFPDECQGRRMTLDR